MGGRERERELHFDINVPDSRIFSFFLFFFILLRQVSSLCIFLCYQYVPACLVISFIFLIFLMAISYHSETMLAI